MTNESPDSEQKPWIGLEFDYRLQDGQVVATFDHFYTPQKDVPDPAFDPNLANHVHIVIPYEALNFEVAAADMDYISFEYGSQ